MSSKISPNTKNFIWFVVLAIGMGGLYYLADEQGWLPKPVPKKELTEEEKAEAKKKEDEETKRKEDEAKKKEEEAKAKKDAQPPPPNNAANNEPVTLFQLGDDKFYNLVLFSSRGGGVQQVVLPWFQQADRLGRDVKQNGAIVPLYLIPGTIPQRGKYLREDYQVPDLKPGLVADTSILAEPSYTIFHYASPDDKQPDPLLGNVTWKTDGTKVLPSGEHQIGFEYTLGDPYFVKIKKTFTLAPKDYHVSLKIEFEKQPGNTRQKLRFQVSGPRGLPVEGEWYNSVSRVALIGWETPKGSRKREYEDAASIAINRGGEQFVVGDNKLKYAAIATQFFTSALAVDMPAEKDKSGKNPFAYVRATTEVPLDKKANKDTPQFEDITFRVVSDIDISDKPVVYSFAIYNGPSKVRLLKLLEGDRAVDAGLVDRYLDDFGLKTVTDYRSPTTLGWVADKIFWTDLVIVFTNLMHGFLYVIHLVVPNWALSILVLTIMVRLMLMIPSKKQTQMNMRMMEVQKKLQPEIEKLKEKYKDDFHTFNREKTRLMMQNGFNPFAMMGGCLLLFAQMPVMMGLYFALQESIFFRLDSFLWIDNLAAPDMTVWWSEQIPWLSTPEDVGSFYYLGPFFNVLPLIAVSLMLYQQNKMMPPPTDEQMAAQQRMMKIMMIVIAVMFYKVAAGLALYFIISSVWGILERRFVTKPKEKAVGEATAETGSGAGTTEDEPKPKGMFGRFRERLQKKMEELQKQAEDQASRQVRNQPNSDRRDKKKKRRK